MLCCNFSRQRAPFFHNYCHNDLPLERDFLDKHLGIRSSSSLVFDRHINVTLSEAVEFSDFKKRNILKFLVLPPYTLHDLSTFYFEIHCGGGVIVWHPYLEKDIPRLSTCKINYSFVLLHYCQCHQRLLTHACRIYKGCNVKYGIDYTI